MKIRIRIILCIYLVFLRVSRFQAIETQCSAKTCINYAGSTIGRDCEKGNPDHEPGVIESIHQILWEDLIAKLGTGISVGEIIMLCLDKLREFFNKNYSGCSNISKFIASISQTAFTYGAEVLGKVGRKFGLTMPIVKTQFDDFKNKATIQKHFSDLLGEGTISYSIFIISETVSKILNEYIEGGALVEAVVGFVAGVVVQLLSDKLIRFDGKTPADYVRLGTDYIVATVKWTWETLTSFIHSNMKKALLNLLNLIQPLNKKK